MLGFPRVFLETNSIDILRHPHLVLGVIGIWWVAGSIPDGVIGIFQ